ncbi:MAG: hypothetical protein EON98_05590 [Chitinophagaceae bacterium]|nr:MAG: hypothetical protein EON98_05590 [Chitinophagaceae bacterium]
MDYHILSAPLNKAEYLFFAGTFKHRSTFYKVAVAEQFSYLHTGYSGAYCVLLQSEMGTNTYELYKSDEDVWLCDDPLLQPEIVFLIGSQIDTIKE